MIAAVIFDLDGTIISDEDEYGNAFREVLESLGKRVDKSFPHIGGIGVQENWPILLSKYNIKTKKSVEELTKETQEAYLKELSSVSPKPGFDVFVKDLRKRKIKIGLATSNSRFMLEKVFDALKLEKYFDVTTTGEEVKFKKPAPDLFLLTASKLKAKPKDCLVFEDSRAGVKAAHAAGMKVVGIARDEIHKTELKDADILISSFRKISFSDLKNMKNEKTRVKY